MKITGKRFIDSILKWKWKGFNIENYWNNGLNGHNAVFLNYKKGFENKGEYVKIYCDGNLYSYPNLKIQIYLLNRERGGICKRDLLLKTFSDFQEYKDYVEKNLFNEVKKLNDTKKEFYN